MLAWHLLDIYQTEQPTTHKEDATMNAINKTEQTFRQMLASPAFGALFRVELRMAGFTNRRQMTHTDVARMTAWALATRFNRAARSALLEVDRAARQIGAALTADLLGDCGIESLSDLSAVRRVQDHVRATAHIWAAI
jgi:hypothetical protein